MKTNTAKPKLDPHGCCPECGTSWDAGAIFDTLRPQDWCKHLSDDELHQEIDISYGKDPPQRFSRLVGIYCQNRDRTVAWQCPDCKTQWPRN